MDTISDFIETEDFDREYGLKDLLPLPLVEELLHEIDKGVSAAVIFSDGRPYCGKNLTQSGAEIHSQQHKNNSTKPIAFASGATRGLRFRLLHEMETIGFLDVETQSGAVGDDELARLGRFCARALTRMIYLGYRQRMTAGLHGQVVSESYQSLKEKARQLAQSEEKYRLLAENLEAEVVRKTREIRDAQVFILQQEKMASIGQLAAGIAHEINNPMGFIISNLNTLRTNTSDMGKLIGEYQGFADRVSIARSGLEDITEIKNQLSAIGRFKETIDIDFMIEDTDSLIDESLDGARRIKEIVQSLHDFTHPSIDSAESVQVNQCLDTTLAVLSSHLPADISIHRDYAPLPIILCHLREINQVFFNLLKNAIQAVDGSGEITIRTRPVDGGVKISIQDNGPGMDSAIIDHVFEPFFTTREVGAGAGLGLTQAYNTVRSHGGDICVKSSLGAGSTFTINLPMGHFTEEAVSSKMGPGVLPDTGQTSTP